MAFKTYGTNGKQTSNSENQVDYNKLNEYVVETAGLQSRETLIGYVTGIVDLGIQEMEDSQTEFKGTAEDEAKEIEANSEVYFIDGKNEDGKDCRMLCKPQKATQAVAVCVDFPDIMLDKGQFFGESNEAPLRIYLGGQFYNPATKKMQIGRPTPLRMNTKLGKWSFDKKHLFYKMAVSSKLIKVDEPFVAQDIDQLLGKAFQFEVQVFFKEHKGKKYYQEYIKFIGGLGRGQTAPELPIEPFVIQFDDENTKDVLSNLRNQVINSIKAAKNYEGSAIQKQLEANSSSSSKGADAADDDDTSTPEQEVKQVVKTTRQGKTTKAANPDDIKDCPF